MNKITTLEMEVAIMHYFGVRQNIVVPNVSWAFFRHECDILSLSASGYATEVELKISKSDLKADAKKKHKHESALLKYLYFAVPDYLVDFALLNIPERAGLLSVCRIENTGYYKSSLNVFYEVPKIRVHVIRKAKNNESVKKWSDVQIHKLLRVGVMRILGLKRKLLKYKLEKEGI